LIILSGAKSKGIDFNLFSGITQSSAQNRASTDRLKEAATTKQN